MTSLLKGGQASSSTYTFSSQPKPVAGSRKKYRDPNEVVDATLYRDPKETCITWDKRVHRGNTYSMYTQNAIKEALEQAENPPAPAVRRKRKPQEKSLFDMALPDKERVPVDLTGNLIAKEEAKVLDTVEAQTDEFLPEPPAEQYQPQKTGVDTATQVEKEDNLFIFDAEVEPILEVLINKTLEQSIMEVEEEFELDTMQEFKTEWFKRQEIMMKSWEEQVAEEWVRWNEKEEVLKQKREEKRKEAQVLLKIQATATAKAHLKGLVPGAIESLSEVAFPDMKGIAITREFLPQIFGQVQKQVESRVKAESTIKDMLRKNVKAVSVRQKAARKELVDKFAVMEARRFEEAKIRHGNIRIYIPDSNGEPVAIGPIEVDSKKSIAEIESDVEKWVKLNRPDLEDMFKWGVRMCLRDENGKPLPIDESANLFEAKAGQISMLPKDEPTPDPLDDAQDYQNQGNGDGDNGDQ